MLAIAERQRDSAIGRHNGRLLISHWVQINSCVDWSPVVKLRSPSRLSYSASGCHMWDGHITKRIQAQPDRLSTMYKDQYMTRHARSLVVGAAAYAWLRLFKTLRINDEIENYSKIRKNVQNKHENSWKPELCHGGVGLGWRTFVKIWIQENEEKKAQIQKSAVYTLTTCCFKISMHDYSKCNKKNVVRLGLSINLLISKLKTGSKFTTLCLHVNSVVP